jgi:DNA-binding Xre family transcriptional regulator
MELNFMETLNLKTTKSKPMNKPAEKHESEFLTELLSEISPKEQAKTDYRMMLAAKIDKARIAKGWSKKDLADRMGKRPSEITKWLSGTHNFTADTLFELQYLLEDQFINVGGKRKDQILHFHLSVSQVVNTANCVDLVSEPKPTYSYAAWASLNQGSC